MALPATTGAQPYPKMPVLEPTMAAVVLIVNVIVPGVGTIIAGVLSGQKLIGRGIAQLLLALIIVGWIWAIVNGVQALQNATWGEKNGVKPA